MAKTLEATIADIAAMPPDPDAEAAAAATIITVGNLLGRTIELVTTLQPVVAVWHAFLTDGEMSKVFATMYTEREGARAFKALDPDKLDDMLIVSVTQEPYKGYAATKYKPVIDEVLTIVWTSRTAIVNGSDEYKRSYVSIPVKLIADPPGFADDVQTFCDELTAYHETVELQKELAARRQLLEELELEGYTIIRPDTEEST